MQALALFADVPVPQPVTRAQIVKCDGSTYWADCVRCGRGSLPVTVSRTVRPYGSSSPARTIRAPYIFPQGYPGDAFELRARRDGSHSRSTLGQCAGCGDTVPLRITRCTHSYADKPREQCGAACLGGRRDCSCRCEGRCHGAGVCLCGNR